MSRSVWKGPYTNANFFEDKGKILSISRSSEIIPKFLGLTFKIYNGKKYVNLTVTDSMIGHKFGEFAFTRAIFVFKKKLKKK